MTDQTEVSYVRFPEKAKTVPERSLETASAAMDRALETDGKARHLQDRPTAMAVHDVYETLKK